MKGLFRSVGVVSLAVSLASVALAAPIARVENGATPDKHVGAPLLAPAQVAGVNMEKQNAVIAPGANLVPNPSLETGANGIPDSWAKGGYGTNTRILTYPVGPAEDGSRAANVTITSYTSGDAKWYFAPIPATPGQVYQFSDYATSSVPSEIDVQVKLSDGSYKYIVLAKPAASATYHINTAQFTAPAGAVSMTIFHVIKSVGSLTVDNYGITAAGSGGGSNYVTNGDFETAGPAGWSKGGYGTNTRTLTYPVAGVGGSKAAQVLISSYTSGDAAWFFTPIQLPTGIYTYSDTYQSNIPSTVEIQYHKSDGSYSYQDLVFDPPQGSFTKQTIGFIVPRGTTDVTVYHLIQAVGTLTIDNVDIEANTDTNGVFANGAVTLSFDDGWLSQFQNAIPAMDQYGFKGTFYIITHELADYGYSGFVSKAQIGQMYADGQEIGAHTQTHPYLTELSPDQQKQEIAGSRNDLLAMNVGPINSFAYPYGDYDATTLQIVKDAGFEDARTTITGNTTPNADPYQLPRMIVVKSTTPAQIESWIDEAIAEKSWLILELHEVNTSGDTYSITPANFSTVMSYLAQKHVMVATMQQGYDSLAH